MTQDRMPLTHFSYFSLNSLNLTKTKLTNWMYHLQKMNFLPPLITCHITNHQDLIGSLPNSTNIFLDILAPLFVRSITEIKQNSSLPVHTNTAVTNTVTFAQTQHPTLLSNYRSISLINVDLKIISKALA